MFFYLVFAAMLGLARKWLVPTLVVWSVFEIIAFAFLRDASNLYLRLLGMPLPIEFAFGAFVGSCFRAGAMPFVRPIAIAGLAAAIVAWSLSSQASVYDDVRRSDLMRIVEFGIPAACIVYGAIGLEYRHAALAPTWAVKLGDASYALYLTHLPIEIGLNRFGLKLHARGATESAAIEITIFAIVIAASLATHRFVEKPISTYLHRKIQGGMRRSAA